MTKNKSTSINSVGFAVRAMREDAHLAKVANMQEGRVLNQARTFAVRPKVANKMACRRAPREGWS